MKLQDGQKLEINRVHKISWDEFISQDKDDIRDGMTPEDYVRNLRDFDRELL